MANRCLKANLRELKAIIEVQRGRIIFDKTYLEKLLKEIGKETFSKCPICRSGELYLTPIGVSGNSS